MIEDLIGRLGLDAAAYGINAAIIVSRLVDRDAPLYEIFVDGRPAASVEIYETGEELADTLIEFFQEVMEEEVNSIWPSCPAHLDAMYADLNDAGWWWVCEHDIEVRVALGELARTRAAASDAERLDRFLRLRSAPPENDQLG